MHGVKMIFEDKPVAFVCMGNASMKNTLKDLEMTNKKGTGGHGFVQLFDYNKKNIGRIATAYINARLRQEEQVLKSNSVAMEMLMLVAGKHNIKEAIEFAGAKEDTKFILFATEEGLAINFARKNGIKIIKKYKLMIDPATAPDVAAFMLSA